MAWLAWLGWAAAGGGGAVARADHTGDDARRTTKRLEAILRQADAENAPRAKKPKPRPKRVVADAPPPAVAESPKPGATSGRPPARHPAPSHRDGDALGDIIEHAMRIPFDEKEWEAHTRDLPKTPEELDAHLRRLDAALKAPHRH
jgi:hypothetical protein